jgi:hypothetical protein
MLSSEEKGMHMRYLRAGSPNNGFLMHSVCRRHIDLARTCSALCYI